MQKLSLKAKLFLVLGMLSMVAMVIAFVGITRLGSLNNTLNTIVEVTSTKQLIAARMRQSLLAIHRAEKNFIMAEEKEEMDKHASAIATFEAQLDKQQQQIGRLVDAQGRQNLETFRKAYEQYKVVQKEVCDNSLRNTNLQAFELSSGVGRERYEKAEGLARSIADRNDREVSSTIDEVKKKVNSEELAGKLDSADQAATRALESARLIQDCLAMQRAEKNLVLARTDEEMDRYSKAVAESDSQMKQRIAAIQKTATEEGKRTLGEFQTAWNAWMENFQKVQTLSRENSNNVARILSGTKGREAIDAAEAALKQIADRSDTEMNEAAAATDKLYATARALMLGVSIGGITTAVLLAFFIIRGLVRTLRHTIGQLSEGASQVNEAAGQVSQASQQLAEGASEQASSLEETSSALEELAAMTRTNASNAQEANDLSTQASTAANQGDKTMGHLNEAMTAINESSDKIRKIIKVIEEIAFQTNLLALNAAVEAARAGEHGKGFAVVADEVRNLAQRAAQAAKETTTLIEDSVTRTREGGQVAGEVGRALNTIVTDVQKVSDLINGIAQASQEQAQGVDQINTAVSQMDKVTQLNASSAEEAASASEELSAQATATKKLVEDLVRVVEGGADQSGRTLSHAGRAGDSKPKKGLHFAVKGKSGVQSARPQKAEHTPSPDEAADLMEF